MRHLSQHIHHCNECFIVYGVYKNSGKQVESRHVYNYTQWSRGPSELLKHYYGLFL